MRSLFVLLLFLSLATPARADFGAHSAAICGAIVRSETDLRKTISKDYGERGAEVEYHNLEKIEAFARTLDHLDPKQAKDAQGKLTKFIERTRNPEFRTAAITLSGENADSFLASTRGNAANLGQIARKHKAIHPIVIGFFGVRAVGAGFAIYSILEKDLPISLAVLAGVAGLWKGSAVVKYLMRARASPLEAFLKRETAILAARSAKVNLLSVTGHKVLDYKLTKFVDGDGINPYSADIVYETLPFGAPNISRLFKGKNPVIRRRESNMDLIAIPHVDDPNRRTLIVLLAEEI